jgi:predicted 3-demethylubiquinone-9 3-methyltransferase (glyoxalase superfamily)
MAHSVRPFLMFQNKDAEAAMRFYVSLFPGGKVLEFKPFGKGEAGAEGTVKTAVFSIAGQEIRAFEFTPSHSLFIESDSEAEVDRLATALAEGGKFLMPLGEYDFSRRFAWLVDRYGVSWQINLK